MNYLHLVDYDPKWAESPYDSACYGHPVYSLMFTCPLCGPPHKIALLIHDAPYVPGVIWSYRQTSEDWDTFTLSPSINNENHLGKKCGLHIVVHGGKFTL